MSDSDLADRYHAYIACLNRQDWLRLREFVREDIRYNEADMGFAAYRDLLERNFATIPDLRFEIAMLVVDGDHVASRLAFDCTPTGAFLGLPINGRRVVFTENVFYRFDAGAIAAVWSVLDKAAIEAQLGAG